MMPEAISLLDHGYVRLVDHMGDDLSVVRSARVSYDAAWRTGEDGKSDANLIKYLWKNHHTTPFEAVQFTFEVKAPIFVFRQWHRHRTQSYNEVSARYTELPAEWYVPMEDTIGAQSTTNKQMRVVNEITDEEYRQKSAQLEIYNNTCQAAYDQYQAFIAVGWPRELARMCLPLSMYSQMFVSMNLLNLFKFLGLRLHEHAQYEIRVYAQAMLELITPYVPVCARVFKGEEK